MKRTVFAITAILSSVLICIFGFIVLKKSCETLISPLKEIAEYARNDDIETAKKKTDEMILIWEETHGKIEALTHHSETDELEEIVKSLPVYASQSDMERLEEKSEIAINRLEHIRENELPKLSNIF